ncbi:MAG: polysaccharide biosynthesis tyrosine autokinase, partial [Deltaproteobacteria bacterium]|nr:polysaccharide biosynthesis tyrosine autokinase [Deltaproteobacteria bacterium]
NGYKGQGLVLAQYDINLREYWRILKKRKLVVSVFAIGLGLLSFFLTILKAPDPLYTSVCSIKFEKEATFEELFARTITNPLETQITVIKSYPVLQRAAEELGIIPYGAVGEDGQLKEEVIPIIEGLQSQVEVSREEYTNILNITVTDRKAVFARDLASAIGIAYKEFHAEEQMRRTSDALKYIREQLDTARKDLRLAEEAFNQFTHENQLISLDMQSEVLLKTNQDIQNNLKELDEDMRELEGIRQRLAQFIEDPSGLGDDYYSTKASKQYQNVNDALVGLLLQKESLLEDFTPQHPEIVGIDRKIIENVRKMSLLLQLEINELERKKIDFNNGLKDIDKKTSLLMDKKLEYDRLKRRVDTCNSRTVLLEAKEQEASIRRAEKPEEVTIVKQALVSTQPVNPPKTAATGAMGIVIGLIVGIIVGFIVETFDTSLGAIEDVEETLGTQVLGIIPQADGKDIRESLEERYPNGIKETIENQLVYLVSHFVPKSMMAESFRALRTNIQFKETEKKIKSIAVASTSPEEGKTLVTANLSITMAQAGMKVLLVGSDLRKPVVDGLFGVERSPGLTDVLMENHPWRDTVKTVTDMIMGHMGPEGVMMTPGLDNLHIITSGSIPPNPAELIDSEYLKNFLEEAKQDYDMIIFDSPPILSTADAAILAAKVDGVLLVYRVGAVSRGLLRRSKAQLERVHCDLIGVVLNGMKADVSPDFQDYKYYSYNYTYGEKKKNKNRLGRVGNVFRYRVKDRLERVSKMVSSGNKQENPPKKETKMLSRVNSALVLVAAVLLTLGILWWSGIIESSKSSILEAPLDRNLMDLEGKRGSVEGRRKPGVGTPEMKAVLSDDTPQAQIKTPIAKETVLKEKGEDNPRSFVAVEQEKAFSESETDMQAEQPKLETIAPVIESMMDAKQTVGSKTPMPPEGIPLFPFSILVSHCRDMRSAEEVIFHYSKRDLIPYRVKVELSNGIWYRVFVGAFKDRMEAETFKKNHGLEEARIMKTAYANLIGSYASSEELQHRLESLKELGYSPYVTKNQDGEYRLLIGAFLTKEGAESQYQDLRLNEVESRVIKR